MHRSHKRELVACDEGNLFIQRIESSLFDQSCWSPLLSVQNSVVIPSAVYFSRLYNEFQVDSRSRFPF